MDESAIGDTLCLTYDFESCHEDEGTPNKEIEVNSPPPPFRFYFGI